MSTQLSEHAVATSPSNPRRAAQKLIKGMVKARQAAGQNPVIAPTSAKATQPAVVVGGNGTPSRPADGVVYVRHMVKPRRAFILIKNTRVYGTASNWATKDEFKTAEEAIAWAKRAKLRVAD